LNSSDRDKDFTDLAPVDLRPWLALPVSRLLEQYLLSERDKSRDAITAFVFEGDATKVNLAAAGVRIYETLLELLHPPEPDPEEIDEIFVDPGAIPPPPGGSP
jgi:hypothetical protein